MVKLISGENDLQSLYPSICAEWDYTKNGDVTPDTVLAHSGKKYAWICSKGHSWITSVSCRTRGQNCPYCSGHRACEDNCLANLFPSIAEEWDYSKNKKLTPKDVTAKSKKIVWWICSKGHQYEMPIIKRTDRGSNCPICSGHRTQFGVNDFATIHPEIAKEWNYEKNSSLLPTSFSKANGKKVWWKCKYGHEWQATIKDRAYGTGCPFCKNRFSTSFAEQAIFFYVQKLYPDAQNRYKSLFNNNMELDIYIPSIRVGIEFDGGYWHSTENAHKKECLKYQLCKQHDIFLIRIKENETKWRDVADIIYFVPKSQNRAILQDTIQAIINSIDKETNGWTRKNPLKYESSIRVDLEKDKNEIQKYLSTIPNSIYELRKDLLLDWNYEKNSPLLPEMFSIYSNEYAWWKCHVCGYEWKTVINHRGGKRKSGCPKCSELKRKEHFTKLKIQENGSLASNNPKLAKEWHPTLNPCKPSEVTVNTNKKYWWVCPTCKYEWQATPNNRNKGAGCPCCSGRVPQKGVTDLKTLYPNLATQWDYVKNENMAPEDFLPGSSKKMWWICPICKESWQATIYSRAKGSSCPKKHKNNGDLYGD